MRFVIGYYGHWPRGSMDNDQTVSWIKGKVLHERRRRSIGQRICSQRQKRASMNLGGMTLDIAQAIDGARAQPRRDRRPHHAIWATFNINFNATRTRRSSARPTEECGEAKRGVSIATDVAKAKQVQMDQQFGQDAR